jgi:hypothetical protein
MLGRRPQALAILSELRQHARKKYVPPTTLAHIYLGLGEKERALGLLEQAYLEHDIDLVWLKVFWMYDPLRSEPRFRSLLHRMAFPPNSELTQP